MKNFTQGTLTLLKITANQVAKQAARVLDARAVEQSAEDSYQLARATNAPEEEIYRLFQQWEVLSYRRQVAEHNLTIALFATRLLALA